MRILHLPSNPADQAGIVVRELRAQGHEAELWHFGEPPFGFEADRVFELDERDPAAVWPVFLEAVERFDVFHFWFARTFFSYGWHNFPPYWDLPVLRMLGKRIVFTFVGSECRTRDVMERTNPYAALFYEQYAPDESRIRSNLDVISRYADDLLAMSVELMPYVPGSSYIPRAFPLAQWEEQPAEQREVPVIVHIPSRRSLKGTDRIVAAMEQLRAEGLPFEFRLFEGLPHDELVKLCRDADVIIDQLVMGDHGIASVEAMASSRVAVAYLIDPVKDACPGLPVYEANPDDIVDRMRALILDRSLRLRLAAAGRAWVAEHWNAPDVARRHLEIYAGTTETAGRSFPGWVTVGGDRRIERLEASVAARDASIKHLRAEMRASREELARVRRELAAARAWSVKQMLPPGVRRGLKRLRGR